MIKIYLIVINSCLGSLFFGYLMGIYNSCQKLIAKEYDMKPTEIHYLEGMITSSVPLGSIFGALLSSYLLQWGRRYSMIACDSISFVGVLLTLIHGLPLIIIGRLLCGLGVGNE